MNIAIIGGGVGGQMLALGLLERELPASTNVHWYSADSFIPPCSLSTTSIVRRAGISQGVNQLGDCLYQSFDEFETLYKRSALLKKATDLQTHHQLWSADSPKKKYFRRRFPASLSLPNWCCHFNYEGSSEKAYFINPYQLKKLIEEKFSCQKDWKIFKNNFVQSLHDEKTNDQVKLRSFRGESSYDKVFLATGWDYQYLTEKKLPVRECVEGHFLEIPAFFLPEEVQGESWSLNIYKTVNLAYRRDDHQLLVFSYNKKGQCLLPEKKELNALYLKARGEFPHWPWPCLSEKFMKVGVRAKGVRRVPFAYWANPRIAIMNGLYKNGYSLSVKFSRDLLEGFTDQKS